MVEKAKIKPCALLVTNLMTNYLWNEFWLSWTLTGVSLLQMTDGKQAKMSRW